jgi:Mg2+ and Co2+ transporter CorA
MSCGENTDSTPWQHSSIGIPKLGGTFQLELHGWGVKDRIPWCDLEDAFQLELESLEDAFQLELQSLENALKVDERQTFEMQFLFG